MPESLKICFERDLRFSVWNRNSIFTGKFEHTFLTVLLLLNKKGNTLIGPRTIACYYLVVLVVNFH